MSSGEVWLMHLFIPRGNYIPPDASCLATGKVCREVCRGKQGQLKVFAYVPLVCGAMKVNHGATTCVDSKPDPQLHKLNIRAQGNFLISQIQVLLIIRNELHIQT